MWLPCTENLPFFNELFQESLTTEPNGEPTEAPKIMCHKKYATLICVLTDFYLFLGAVITSYERLATETRSRIGQTKAPYQKIKNIL